MITPTYRVIIATTIWLHPHTKLIKAHFYISLLIINNNSYGHHKNHNAYKHVSSPLNKSIKSDRKFIVLQFNRQRNNAFYKTAYNIF